jgi:hypothetical protein
VLIAVVIALIGFRVELSVMRARRYESDGRHLEVDIAGPETLAESEAADRKR